MEDFALRIENVGGGGVLEERNDALISDRGNDYRRVFDHSTDVTITLNPRVPVTSGGDNTRNQRAGQCDETRANGSRATRFASTQRGALRPYIRE